MKNLFILLLSLTLLSCSTNKVEKVIVEPYFKKTYYSNEFGTLDSTSFAYVAIEDGIYKTDTEYGLKVKIVYDPSDSLLSFTFYEHGEYETEFENEELLDLKIEGEESIQLIALDNIVYDNKTLTKLIKTTDKKVLKCILNPDYGKYNFTINVDELKKIM
jgi:hypothetical protein